MRRPHARTLVAVSREARGGVLLRQQVGGLLPNLLRHFKFLRLRPCLNRPLHLFRLLHLPRSSTKDTKIWYALPVVALGIMLVTA